MPFDIANSNADALCLMTEQIENNCRYRFCNKVYGFAAISGIGGRSASDLSRCQSCQTGNKRRLF